MAKKTAKRTPKTAASRRTGGDAPSLAALFGKAGTTVKIIRLEKNCGTGESAGRFVLEGTFKHRK